MGGALLTKFLFWQNWPMALTTSGFLLLQRVPSSTARAKAASRVTSRARMLRRAMVGNDSDVERLDRQIRKLLSARKSSLRFEVLYKHC